MSRYAGTKAKLPANIDAPAEFPDATLHAVIDEFLARVLEKLPALRQPLESVNSVLKAKFGPQAGLAQGVSAQQINALFPSATVLTAGGVAVSAAQKADVVFLLHFVRQLRLVQRAYNELRAHVLGPGRNSPLAQVEADDAKRELAILCVYEKAYANKVNTEMKTAANAGDRSKAVIDAVATALAATDPSNAEANDRGIATKLTTWAEVDISAFSSLLARELRKVALMQPSTDTLIGKSYSVDPSVDSKRYWAQVDKDPLDATAATYASASSANVHIYYPSKLNGSGVPDEGLHEKGAIPLAWEETAVPDVGKATDMLLALAGSMQAFLNKRFDKDGFVEGDVVCPIGQDIVLQYDGATVSDPALVRELVSAMRQYGQIDKVQVACGRVPLALRGFSVRDALQSGFSS